MTDVFESAFGQAERLVGEVRSDRESILTLNRIADLLVETFRSGNKVLVCGNGGSMSDAAHFAEELTGRFRDDRQPYPAMALNDPAHLSCVANDFGFDFVFSRLVEAFGKEADVLMVLSTSGASQNLIEAARVARSRAMCVVGFLGRGGGEVGPLCDHRIDAPGDTADRIQELHMLALHAMVEAIEMRMGHASR